MLSIVVSWKNRNELRQSIDSLIETADLLDGEVIIVNFDGDRESLIQMLPHNHPRLKIINVSNQKLFNKAATNNIGASQAQFDYLFFCDCDIILNPIDIKKLLHKIMESPKYFGTLKGVTETVVNSIQNNHIVSFGYELVIKTSDGRVLNIVDSEEDATDGSRNAPGLMMTSKPNFLAVNGYNGTLVGWGWEDQDMIGRLTLGAGLDRMQIMTPIIFPAPMMKIYPNINFHEYREQNLHHRHRSPGTSHR